MEHKQSQSVLLQDHMHGELQWCLFENPLKIISCSNIAEVNTCFDELEQAVKDGNYAAGYVSYEAASAFNSKMQTQGKLDCPLLWFGIYKKRKVLKSLDEWVQLQQNLLGADTNSEVEWAASLSHAQYIEDVKNIHQKIAQGDTYQVNHTFRLKRAWKDDPIALFHSLCAAQASEYCAYLNLGLWQICSASPELFFQYDNGLIKTKPMKGTAKRASDPNKDIRNKHWLQQSEKNRAENVMIVDMLRNDLGRFAEPSSVKVESLCDVEAYPTVFQMTSTITAKTHVTPFEVFKSMFPCASVTGAPKIKTMEIIRSLEAQARGVYTGSIGFFSPDNKAQFNVAIRTAVIDQQKNTATYGVGSGVIWDSNAEEEYAECIAKSAILTV